MSLLVPFDRPLIDRLEARLPGVGAAFSAQQYKLPELIYYDNCSADEPRHRYDTKNLHIGASWTHFAENSTNFFMRQVIFENSCMPYHWPRNSPLYVSRDGQIMLKGSYYNLNPYSATDMEDPINVYLFEQSQQQHQKRLLAHFTFDSDNKIRVYVMSPYKF